MFLNIQIYDVLMFVSHRDGGAGRLSEGRDGSACNRNSCRISGICGGNHSHREEQDGATEHLIHHNIQT